MEHYSFSENKGILCTNMNGISEYYAKWHETDSTCSYLHGIIHGNREQNDGQRLGTQGKVVIMVQGRKISGESFQKIFFVQPGKYS